MSEAEGLMWRLDRDPHLASTFATVTVLDQPLDVDRLLRRLERASVLIPRLRRRVQPAPAGLGPPAWVDDPDFDLLYHVRHVALPEPGSVRQLLDFTSRFVADPFDRTRPLWEFVAVDGLEGGRGALVQKMHHTITDGEGGLRLSMQFLDLERDAPDPPPVAADVVDRAAAENGPVNGFELAQRALRLPVTVMRETTSLLTQPMRLPSLVGDLTDVDRARSPLWTARSLRRRIEVLRVPLDAVKAGTKALGGTLNAGFITAAAAAAGEYHRRLGAPVGHLRASMALSTRTAASGSNAFTLARLLVPTGDLDVAERFRQVSAAAEAAKSSRRHASLELLALVAATMPTSVVTRLARAQAQTVDFATSNVRAAPVALYLAGSQVLQTYPLGPTGGVAFNLTLMTYNGSLDMGVNIDAAAVDEPELLTELLEEAFAALAAAGR
jgi:WS/DGAT/MGAT family acyltransferase